VKNGFHKRTWAGPGDFLRGLGSVLGSPRVLAGLVAGRRVPARFRERLMLAVTGVNECRYCAFVHGGLGSASGLTGEEIRAILSGRLAEVPEDERDAILFAIRWAERGGAVDPADLADLIAKRGQAEADQIVMALRLIRIGNLTGNTMDSWMFRLGLPV
jgi:AhpD family alkylhydroperoxidase